MNRFPVIASVLTAAVAGVLVYEATIKSGDVVVVPTASVTPLSGGLMPAGQPLSIGGNLAVQVTGRSGNNPGTSFGQLLGAVDDTNRITPVPVQPNLNWSFPRSAVLRKL